MNIRGGIELEPRDDASRLALALLAGALLGFVFESWLVALLAALAFWAVFTEE